MSSPVDIVTVSRSVYDLNISPAHHLLSCAFLCILSFFQREFINRINIVIRWNITPVCLCACNVKSVVLQQWFVRSLPSFKCSCGLSLQLSWLLCILHANARLSSLRKSNGPLMPFDGRFALPPEAVCSSLRFRYMLCNIKLLAFPRRELILAAAMKLTLICCQIYLIPILVR